MTKSAVAVAIALTLTAGSAWAAKPDWAGEGMPDMDSVKKFAQEKGLDKKLEQQKEKASDFVAQQVAEKKQQALALKDKAMDKASGKKDDAGKADKNKPQEKADKNDSAAEKQVEDRNAAEKGTGLEKQQQKKADQERKESGKGSETGQQKREEQSKKWWKFWE